MSLWRLEWLRLVRTPRALALGAVFTFFGLLEPGLTSYQGQIFSHLGNGVQISVPPPTPAAGIRSYAGELGGVGLVVVWSWRPARSASTPVPAWPPSCAPGSAACGGW